MQDFLQTLVSMLISDDKDTQIITKSIDSENEEITIFVDKKNAGILIGKDGKMINAIRTFVSGYKAKDGKNYQIHVKSHEEK